MLIRLFEGEIPERMLKGDWEGAKNKALEFSRIFENRFYLEVQNHGIPDELKNIENMKKLASELSLPLVCTNDAHYAKHEHWEAHDVHICLGTGKDRDDPKRLDMPLRVYFKSQDQMFKMFKDVPNAIENTSKNAESIDIELPMGNTIYQTPITRFQRSGPKQLFKISLCRRASKDMEKYHQIFPID